MKKYIIPVVILILITPVKAQEQVLQEDIPIFNRVISVSAVTGLYLGTLYDSYRIWWMDDQRPFTFMEGPWFDSKSDQGMDKLGHFFTSYLFYKVQKNIFLWGGFSPVKSKMLSASLTTLMALIIEVGDGFSRYGFDYKDFVFNSGGLAYGMLQDEIPFFQNINFKWSYYPTHGFAFPPKFSDHYEGHIYWVTFNVPGLFNLPDNTWLDYIQPAVGYSISTSLKREYMVGLDLNLLPFFRSDKPIIHYTGDILNLFHLPSPGIRYNEEEKPVYKLLLLN
jgi:hypothetical protein